MNYDSVAWLWITVAPRVPHRARREQLLVMWASQNMETEKGAVLSDPLQCHILFHLDTAHPSPSPLWLVWGKKAAAKGAMQKGEEPRGMEAAAVLGLCSETGPRNLLFLPIRALLFQQMPTGRIHECSARQPTSPSSHPPTGWQSIMPQISPAVFLLVFIHLCKGCRRLFSRKKKKKNSFKYSLEGFLPLGLQFKTRCLHIRRSSGRQLLPRKTTGEMFFDWVTSTWHLPAHL